MKRSLGSAQAQSPGTASPAIAASTAAAPGGNHGRYLGTAGWEEELSDRLLEDLAAERIVHEGNGHVVGDLPLGDVGDDDLDRPTPPRRSVGHEVPAADLAKLMSDLHADHARAKFRRAAITSTRPFHSRNRGTHLVAAVRGP